MSAAEEAMDAQHDATAAHVRLLGKLTAATRGDAEQQAVDAFERAEERRLEERAARRRMLPGETEWPERAS